MLEIQSKTCRKCGETKPLSAFYGKSRIGDFPKSSAGFSSDCKNCTKLKMRERRTLLGDEHKRQLRNWDYKRKFGITLEQYNQMFMRQSGCCAICGKHQAQFKRALAVDHDHVTGMVRSLLCVNCNVGIGSFRDDVALLGKAIKYLNKHFNHGSASAQVAHDADLNGGLADEESVHQGRVIQ